MDPATAMKPQRADWDDEKFISRCRVAAARKGWSLEELCERAGLDRYYLTKTAAVGRRIDAVISLARTAGVTVEWLAGLDGESLTLDSSELARLGAVANVAAHLYVAINLQRSDMDANAIIRSVLELIGHKAGKPARAIAAGTKAAATADKGADRAARTRRPRTS